MTSTVLIEIAMLPKLEMAIWTTISASFHFDADTGIKAKNVFIQQDRTHLA